MDRVVGPDVAAGYRPGWVPFPLWVRGDFFAFHEEGIGAQDGAVVDCHAVVYEGSHPECAVRADGLGGFEVNFLPDTRPCMTLVTTSCATTSAITD